MKFFGNDTGHLADSKGFSRSRGTKDTNTERPLHTFLGHIGIHDILQGDHRINLRRIGGAQMTDIEDRQIMKPCLPVHLFFKIMKYRHNFIQIAICAGKRCRLGHG